MTYRSLVALLALTTTALDSDAGPLRRRAQPTTTYRAPSYAQPTPTITPVSYTADYTPVTTTVAPDITTASAAAGDGLDEVNAQRAARGLRPFVRGVPRPAPTVRPHRQRLRVRPGGGVGPVGRVRGLPGVLRVDELLRVRRLHLRRRRVGHGRRRQAVHAPVRALIPGGGPDPNRRPARRPTSQPRHDDTSRGPFAGHASRS